ncbi:MAG TPA: sulfoacetaldehyde acetyltransferase [Thermodesulfobacteriota bacterium]
MPVMSPSEALVEQLRAEGTEVITGIVGSAFMDALDIFPKAEIRFLPVRHEQTAAHMADGYARVSGKPGVCTAQNGPGITNMVTGIAAAYHAHTPVVMLSPAASTTMVGTNGFQETDQLPIFQPITKYQVRVPRPDRIAESVRTAFRIAIAERGPAQVDIPRDFFYAEIDTEILRPEQYRWADRGPGGAASLDAAARILKDARFPVIISGQGVVIADGIAEVKALAEYLTAPVVTSYLHNDAFPASHPLMAGPLGYCGWKSAMQLISKADVVLALGTRLSIFGTLPQYGFDYFPKTAKIIQVDIDHRQLGLTKPIACGIVGDAREAAREILSRLTALDGGARRPDAERRALVAAENAKWQKELDELASSSRTPMSPKRALRELAAALTPDTIVTTDIGNVCSTSNSFLGFERPRRFLAALSFGNCGFAYPAALGAKVAEPKSPVVAIVGDGAWGMSLQEVITAVQENIPVVACVFNNMQWGAEKKNQIDYYDNRFIGTNLKNPDFAAVARAMGADGHRIEHPGEVRDAVSAALRSGRPTVLDIMVDGEELADPFRRDALKKPVRYLPRYRQ